MGDSFQYSERQPRQQICPRRKSQMIDNLNRAMDLLRRPDARLVQTNGPRGPQYWIVPGDRVDPKVAEKIREHPQVKGGGDSLFPEMNQTWRMRTR
jgi:hypothetical protein